MAKKEEMDLLIENSASLQRVLTDLTIELRSLSDQMSELISIFKEASKTIGEEKAEREIDKERMKSMDEKMEALMEQNKTIAKGILLVETAMRESMDKYHKPF